ncbi:hypothetical protein ACFL08_02045 [Patescibacteria group bacterium]
MEILKTSEKPETGVEKKEKRKFPEFESLEKLGGEHQNIYNSAMRKVAENNKDFLSNAAGKERAKIVLSKILKNFGYMSEQVSNWNDAFSKSDSSPRELAPEIADEFSKKIEGLLKNDQERRVATVKAGVYDKIALKDLNADERDRVIKIMGHPSTEQLIKSNLMKEMQPGRKVDALNDLALSIKIADNAYEVVQKMLVDEENGSREGAVEGAEIVESPKEEASLNDAKEVPMMTNLTESDQDARTEAEISDMEKRFESAESKLDFFKSFRSTLATRVYNYVIGSSEELGFGVNAYEELAKKAVTKYINTHFGGKFKGNDRINLVDDWEKGKNTGVLDGLDIGRMADAFYVKDEETMKSEIKEIAKNLVEEGVEEKG